MLSESLAICLNLSTNYWISSLVGGDFLALYLLSKSLAYLSLPLRVVLLPSTSLKCLSISSDSPLSLLSSSRISSSSEKVLIPSLIFWMYLDSLPSTSPYFLSVSLSFAWRAYHAFSASSSYKFLLLSKNLLISSRRSSSSFCKSLRSSLNSCNRTSSLFNSSIIFWSSGDITSLSPIYLSGAQIVSILFWISLALSTMLSSFFLRLASLIFLSSNDSARSEASPGT